jgi:hypothetical protein
MVINKGIQAEHFHQKIYRKANTHDVQVKNNETGLIRSEPNTEDFIKEKYQYTLVK